MDLKYLKQENPHIRALHSIFMKIMVLSKEKMLQIS